MMEIIRVIPILVSSLVTFILIPIIIKKMMQLGVVGKDMNKRDKPTIPEMGGIAVVIGSIAGFITLFVIQPDIGLDFYACVITLILIALIGMEDGIYNYRRRSEGRKKSLNRQLLKVLLLYVVALPMIITKVGASTIDFPFAGSFDFGILYWLILIPIGITAAANATNLLAGLNGLEIGLGVIITFFLGVVLLMTNSGNVATFSFIIFGALLAFLIYNKYPARVFPGDAGTLVIGGTVAICAILGDIIWIGVILLSPAIVEFIVTLRVKFVAENFGIIDAEGYLAAPRRIESLTHVVMKLKKLKEWQIVRVFWLIEIVIGLGTIGLVHFEISL